MRVITPPHKIPKQTRYGTRRQYHDHHHFSAFFFAAANRQSEMFVFIIAGWVRAVCTYKEAAFPIPSLNLSQFPYIDYDERVAAIKPLETLLLGVWVCVHFRECYDDT